MDSAIAECVADCVKNGTVMIFVGEPESREGRAPADRVSNPASKRYNDEHARYYGSLKRQKRARIAELERSLADGDGGREVPLRFRVLESAAPDFVKRSVLRKADDVFSRDDHDSETSRQRKWLHAFLRIPLGVYRRLPVCWDSPEGDIRDFLVRTKEGFEDAIYGHSEAKEHIVRTIAKWISNPGSRGIVLGLHGPPGCGKTTLVKNCVAKALGLPMVMVPLGGMTDASILNGQQAVYENSTCGAIVSGLVTAGCMNPVIVLDEVDKVGGDSHRGQEVINTLIHMTDPVQNEHFVDNYFADVPIDLSKCLIVMTFNDPSLVSPVLRDRMHVIKTSGYATKDKIQIAKRFLLPRICAQHGVTGVTIEDSAVEDIVARTGPESGVRNLERALDTVVGNINLKRMLGEADGVVGAIGRDAVCKYVADARADRFPAGHMYI